MNILLVGQEAAGLRTLEYVASTTHRLAGLLTSAGSGAAGVSGAAARLRVPVRDARLVKDPTFAREVRDAGVDILLNVHSLHVIHPEVAAAPAIGSFNLHPGPLPRYAGLNTVSWAVARGETEYGVTLHWLEPAIDAGPIAFQSWFALGDEDSALSVMTRCVRAGVELVKRLLGAAAEDPRSIPRLAQDLSQRRYFTGRPPDCCIRWTRPAREIANLVRACDYFPFPSPWGHPRAALHGTPLDIVKARRTGRRADAAPGTIARAAGVEVACGDEWLSVERVLVGGRALPAGEVLQRAARLDDGAPHVT
jgi:UDP-4-amino-4-deoxy-L-arabinose formyltransferase/UDP-glucuronic acid dehydrogenase (UDP-4-keto-hexauronic acid decarboxylating)